MADDLSQRPIVIKRIKKVAGDTMAAHGRLLMPTLLLQ